MHYCTQVATGPKWKACAEARVIELEALLTARKAHMQEVIARALARGEAALAER